MEGLELVGSVHPGCFNQLVRNSLHILFHHKNTEAADHDRQDQGQIGILKSCFHKHSISGDNGYGPGDHHSHHNKAEDDIFPFKLVFSQNITADTACIDYQHRYDHCDHNTVCKVSQEVKVFLEIHIIVENRLFWKESLLQGFNLAVCLKGRKYHPYKRKHCDYSCQAEHDK